VIARDPVAVASRMLFNMFDHVRLDAAKLTGFPLALAAVAGAWFAWRDAVFARVRPVLLIQTMLFLTLVPAFHSERYSLAVLPLWRCSPRARSRRRAGRSPWGPRGASCCSCPWC